MENSIYVGLSRQVALQAQMDIVANNIANMSTPGYRAQNMVFHEYVNKAPKNKIDNPPDPLSQVLDYGHFQTTQEGEMRQTGNPLDVALAGPGWFGVQTSDGTQYTRAGNFQVDVNGDLVTGMGQKVAGAGGGTITIPKGAQEIKIAEDGAVSTERGQVGQLMIVEFANDQDLEATGSGLYQTTAAANPPQNTRAKQGMLEGSNVQAVLEMTRMIDVSRAYQATQKMLDSEHDRQRTMIKQLTKAG